jgi:glycosyltransferase involved in cell wall biosynthesis
MMDIALFGYDGWSPWERRPQLLARALANRGCRVLYMEPGPQLKTLIHSGMKEPRKLVAGTLRHIQKNLWVLTPGLRWTLDRSIVGHEVSMCFFEYYLQQAVKALRFKNPLIGYQSPFVDAFAHNHHPPLTFYDCIDDWRNFPGVPFNIAAHVEDAVLKKSDIVFASSKHLLRILQARTNKSVFYLPNALGPAFLEGSEHDKTKLPPFDGITLGFVGGIGGDHFDWGLLAGLLNRETLAGYRYRIVLVGPLIGGENTARGQELKRSGRLLITGVVAYSQVPGYMNGFDFCVMPWKITALIRGVDPIKIYEYLASGKPVISTYWPELESYRDYVHFASTPQEYEEAVQKELLKQTLQRVEEAAVRRERVEAETWESRAKVMVEHLSRILVEKPY